MVLEKKDVAAVRLAEAGGRLVGEGQLAAAGLDRAEYQLRLGRLEQAGVIRSFRVTAVVPPLLGGDWALAAVMADATQPISAVSVLQQRMPFVTEVLVNLGVPEGLGPTLALLFYSRDFDTDARFVESTSGLGYREISRVAEYSYPVAFPLSGDERQLIRCLLKEPGSDLARLSAAVGREVEWVSAKLDRLLCCERNPTGVLRVQVETSWSEVENFGHFHFLLETGYQADKIRQLLTGTEFSLVQEGLPYRGRFVQAEADVWGTAQLMEMVRVLSRIVGVRVAGVLWNRQCLIHDNWVAQLFG